MTPASGAPPAVPFFLAGVHDTRYCLYHPAAAPVRGALLYVHPFGDEMNRSRRVAALGARLLAARGYGVLQIDLFGCGDSGGEFGDARWEIWKQDLALAHAWLADRALCPVGLWGVRLGALLALDYASHVAAPLSRLLLWQPVLRGSTFLTQFLRLRLANQILGAVHGGDNGTDAMRAALRAGEPVEIGGYQLAPALAAAIDAIDAGKLQAPAVPVDWFELVAAADRPAPPAAVQLAARWRAAGASVGLHAVPDLPFWSTQEVSECPVLLAATCARFGDPANG
jgi:exosortase A-associated hydrolase 2